MSASALRDLLDLPQEVVKSDFVLKLTDGVARPAALMRDYAVTPNLELALDQGLSLVRAAVRDRSSAATYVHGSFGSGKSHYMAVLSLLLANDPDAWSVPELHALYDKHAWVRETKLLRLHLHMTSAATLEDRLFRGYLDETRRLHPSAPLPPLFGNRELFDNAQTLREQVGDAAFFDRLNTAHAADAAATDGWGDLSAADRWDASRFDAARGGHDETERAALFDALVRTWFPAFLGQTQRWVDHDAGLAVITRHAHALGYRGVVVFFDELILWLTSLASDRGRLNNEVQKLAKLVEAQDLARPIPLVGFAARQRDIAEMVGHQFVGADAQLLTDTLKYWEGRFARIQLEDRNLPAIIRKRVVRPRDKAAEERLTKGFNDLLAKLSRTDKETLLGDLGDEKAFREMYPFSPALVEVLVAMSAFLQRDRTALKVLVELLVEHLEDFQFGRVVPVGDLYDVLAGGEEPLDGAMRVRFQDARRLYLNDLLPLLHAKHQTGTPAKCQRLRDDHPPSLGCSNCAQSACRGDNRLVKTMILAQLVPETPVLRSLTVKRVVELNHGSLREIIPGTAGQQAAARLRDYAAQNGKVRVGGGDNPAVSVEIGGIDLRPVIEAASGFDTLGARKARLRSLLFTALELEKVDATPVEHEVDWRGFRRRGRVHYGNVRELDEKQLEVAPGEDFKVVIDYPFDDPSRTPQEDEARIVALKEKGIDTPTAVWLPHFFSDKLQRDLGELVVLDRILEGDEWRRKLEHLRSDDQLRAKAELESLQNQKKQRILNALNGAYGLRRPEGEYLDETRRVDRHFHVLLPEEGMRGTLETTPDKALTAIIHQVLDLRYPRHPAFEHDAGITKRKLENALAWVRRIAEADHQRVALGRGDLAELDVPVRLGFVTANEASATLRTERAQRVESDLRDKGVNDPEVEQVRRAFEPVDDKGANRHGYTRELSDFCVLAWAVLTGREVYRDGQPLKEAPTLGKLAPDLVLVRPALPDPVAWEGAIRRAGELFGISNEGLKTCSGRSLRKFAEQCAERRRRAMDDGADRVAAALAHWAPIAPDGSARRETAESAARLLQLMGTADPVALVKSLAEYAPRTSAKAVEKHVLGARAALAVLDKDYFRGTFEQLRAQTDPRAVDLFAKVQEALTLDEHIAPLGARLEELASTAQKLLRDLQRKDPAPGVGPQHQPSPPPPPPPGEGVVAEGQTERFEALDAELQRVREAIAKAGAGARVELAFTWRVIGPKRGG